MGRSGSDFKKDSRFNRKLAGRRQERLNSHRNGGEGHFEMPDRNRDQRQDDRRFRRGAA
jgi:hypothetical protein